MGCFCCIAQKRQNRRAIFEAHFIGQYRSRQCGAGAVRRELCGITLIIISKHEMLSPLPEDISCILMKKEDVFHEKYHCNGRL